MNKMNAACHKARTYCQQLWIVFIALTAASCQYHFGRGELSESYSTISVPYVQGDQKGELTAEIIKKVTSSGAFRYVNEGGDLILKVKLLGVEEENIDYCYDRKRSGKRKKSIIPIETRVNAIAEVHLVNGATGRTIREPVRISANTEFDHTYYATRNDINIFSLGQINDIDAAREAAMHPLNRNLAESIVDYLINSW